MTARRPPPRRHPPGDAEAGYALVAAVVSIALFAMISIAVVNAARGSVIGAGAEIENARLAAAADAGTALAIQALLAPDRASRWAIDGRPHGVPFDGMNLEIAIEDGRGKIPLNLIDEQQIRPMFETLGLSGNRLDIAVDSFLDWRDDDGDVRLNGAEDEYYAARGIHPRNGALHSIGELALIRGIDRGVVERLAPAATLDFGTGGGFDARFAQPLALAVMSGGGIGAPQVIERERELAGQRPAIELGSDVPLAYRPLIVRVTARGPGDAAFHRETILELTGSPQRPYVVRPNE